MRPSWLLCLILVIGGCSSPKQKAVPSVVGIDNQCTNLATYAKSVAYMKQVGFKLSEIDDYAVNPTIVAFPLRQLRIRVWKMDIKTPAEAYQTIYVDCTLVGYPAMIEILKREDQLSTTDTMNPPMLKTAPLPKRIGRKRIK